MTPEVKGTSINSVLRYLREQLNYWRDTDGWDEEDFWKYFDKFIRRDNES